MEMIKLDLKNVYDFIPEQEIRGMQQEVSESMHKLNAGTGAGNDYLGWLNLPSSISEEDFNAIEKTARRLRKTSEIVVVIGIGGSYLGAKAVNDALSDNFATWRTNRKNPLMIFAGHNIDEDYMHELIRLLDDCTYSIVVISKSGTTTEPAIAFRILREHLVGKIGTEKACERIVAITDGSKGALRKLADQEGYESYVIPDDVGGRFSVLTPVGLVPLAVAGFDIRGLVAGAVEMEQAARTEPSMDKNPAAL